jgi:hypothetical protein
MSDRCFRCDALPIGPGGYCATCAWQNVEDGGPSACEATRDLIAWHVSETKEPWAQRKNQLEVLCKENDRLERALADALRILNS